MALAPLRIVGATDLGALNHPDATPSIRASPLAQPPRAAKRVSPGLELRLQRLEEQKRRREAERRRQASIGRIPQEQLAELEQLHQQRVIEVRRRGRAWSGPPVRVMPSSGGVKLDGGPVSEAETSMLESDVSSIISISERLVHSDSDGEDEQDALHDSHKYRMPDPGKTRLHLRTKLPLSPSPASPRRQTSNSAPTTPKTPKSPRNGMEHMLGSPLARHNASAESVTDGDFVASGLSRAGSIYSIMRMSFSEQLSQLTSVRLPDPDSLAKRISSIPTAKEASKALVDASEQIRMWISKAGDLLSGLNAQDDVEWAAAGGREGIEEVDSAISRFETLVQVYVAAIERLQTRKDITELAPTELTGSVKQMEGILTSWQKVKLTLRGVKEQVEIAMEWEELWNSVLGEIGQELDGLSRLIFEMEEKRHEGAESLLNGKDSIAIDELETIMDEQPRPGSAPASNRLSLPSLSSSLAIRPTSTPTSTESSLLGLFARMQPLRASLDFLPMRLSVFHCRGNSLFPTACLDLEQRRDQLEVQWKRLEGDAESLRRELGEDRWVLVFRNAGRQALKMCESISRSYNKLKDGMDAAEPVNDAPSFNKKIENYEAKKTHYGPAIERVLAIIDRGVLDRLTVNGEILRLQSDMKRRWSALQADMQDMDLVLEDAASETSSSKHLRDSVSTVVSSEPSISSSLVDTPGTSPASSVFGASTQGSFHGSRTPTPLHGSKTRQASYDRASLGGRPMSRISSTSSIPRRVVSSNRMEHSEPRSSPTPSSAATRIELKSETPGSDRPRWRGWTKSENRDFLPLSALEPSPYAKTPVTPKTNFLRSTRLAAAPSTAPAKRTSALSDDSNSRGQLQQPLTGPRKSSLPVSAVTFSVGPGASVPKPSNSSLRPASRPTNGRRSSMLALPPLTDGNEADSESPSHHKSRVPGAPAERRNSMLPPRARSRLEETAVPAQAEKPKWRG
ncbi:hypothetical protein BAUCODRAFT_514759 [Baudoinia panamericana UAMH 10762]|uniref:KAR9-domain-containing protein n=1 Tax=Baudoinia panamericana (strain UAMH 10762) TaxID=717646 RepID=M2MHH6_BAUPA|nr:uncharacterized protein BAUCODRAFT_514759 [Baudoinia panamericana UAMH 10762]EMC96051.1 hypothetical protein BAUCODRAFT_514759 [Baudoinia panamericana UAMH 10762]